MSYGYYGRYGAPAGALSNEPTAGEEGWNSYPAPPMPAAEPVGKASSGVDWESIVGKVGRGLVNIFGQPVAPAYAPPPAPSVPIWVYLTIPVALIGAVALMRRKPSSVGRYRKSRRSRR